MNAMSTHTPPASPPEIEYPDSDGKPLSDNTLQFEWIFTIKGGLDAVFRDDPHVFVAGDLLWYPVEGDNKTRQAPDAMVAIGRPKGYRGSYMQWREGGIAPQAVFEILSPKNRRGEMDRKRAWYFRFGVEEYYEFDPDRVRLRGWIREGGEPREIVPMSGWSSPRLGIRFELADDLTIYGPDGRPFATYVEIARRLDEVEQRAERLAARLRELGIEPDE
jgi:Uma2 family endonuclease